MLQTSNPNRSALINRSHINSKKRIEDEDLSNEISLEHNSSEALNGSILRTIRSNFHDADDYSSNESRTRRNRRNHLSLDISKAILGAMHDVKDPISSKENIRREFSNGQDSQHKRSSLNKNTAQKPFSTKHLPTRFDMRLDLSKVMQVNSFDKIPFQIGGSKDLDSKKEAKKSELKYKFGKLELPIPLLSSTNRSQAFTENRFFMTIPSENDRVPTESIKLSTNQTLNSFINHLGSMSHASSCRNKLLNENLFANEANEDSKKVCGLKLKLY